MQEFEQKNINFFAFFLLIVNAFRFFILFVTVKLQWLF